jgi:hypothetical protein
MGLGNWHDINEVVDYASLERGYIIRDGFFFEAIRHPANVFNAIVVRNPSNATRYGEEPCSQHSLEAHIEYINEHNIESAVVIAEDIHFLSRCPSLIHINIIPAKNAEQNFDFSPLYDHPKVLSVFCATKYGLFDEKSSILDYSRLRGLISLSVKSDTDLNYSQIPTLQSLDVNGMPAKDISELFSSKVLDTLQITSCGIQTLDGLGISPNLQCLYLHHNRALHDISGLREVASSIRALRIVSCPKVKDFSVLHQLDNLEYLFLEGSNKIPDLSFVASMPKLKTLIINMEIVDGNLLPCLNLSYAHCGKMKRYYNVKAKDLPKHEYHRGNSNIDDWRKVR